MSDVKICFYCDGSGKIREDIGYHNSDWISYKCASCNGTGKILRSEFTLDVPYDFNISKLSNIQGQIFEIIRAFESKLRIKGEKLRERSLKK